MSSRAESRHTGFALLAWALLLLAGLAAWLVVLWTGEASRAWRAFLICFLFFTPLAAGLVVWRGIVVAARGGWAGSAERLAAAGSAFAIPSVAALALLWVGADSWAPWIGVTLHQGVWLDTTFVLGRDLASLAAFWGVAWWASRRLERRDRGAAGLLIFVFCVVFSLLGFDLVMALDPEWISSLFGGYFFVSSLYIAVAAWTVLATATGAARGDRLHDLGKLLVTFSILTTYLMYAQLLILYYENLPRETRFLIPRLNGGPWTAISALLLVLVYLGPLLILLSIRAKRSPLFLGTVAGLILVTMWVERWWLVTPTLGGQASLGLSELGATALFAGTLGVTLTLGLRRRPPARAEGEA